MSLLPARFQPEALPTLGALVKAAIEPKGDQYASFYTNTSVLLPDGTSGFITEADCRQIKGAKKARTFEDVMSDPTEAEIDYVMNLRGSCRCFISPPCSRCSNPFTEAEAQEALEETAAELIPSVPAQDAEGWIAWGGGKCPIKEGEYVEARFADGQEDTGKGPGEWWPRCWEHTEDPGDFIVAYRVVSP